MCNETSYYFKLIIIIIKIISIILTKKTIFKNNYFDYFNFNFRFIQILYLFSRNERPPSFDYGIAHNCKLYDEETNSIRLLSSLDAGGLYAS